MYVFAVVVAAVLACLVAMQFGAWAPPRLFAASGFISKTLCSGLFVSHRRAETIQQYDIQPSGGYFANVFLVRVEKDRVTSSLFGLGLYAKTAIYHSKKFGCYMASDDYPPLPTVAEEEQKEDVIPLEADQNPALQQFIAEYEFSDAAFAANQSRALVVVHRGRVVGEQYQDKMLGIGPTTRLHSWSMAKTIHAVAVLHRMASSVGLALDTPVGLEDFDLVRRDFIVNTLNRGLNVTFRDLMGMSDVLQMAEKYELGEGVSDMLFSQGDSAAFASRSVGKPSSPAVSPSDTCRLGWFYSSGVSNVLAKEFRRTFPSHEAYVKYMMDDFLGKIGSSFTFEMDASGTFVGSSFVYATARDFARFGLFLLQEQQRPLLELLQQPHCDSGGLYSSTASVWLNPSRLSPAPTDVNLTGRQDWQRFHWMTKSLPSDCFMLSGYAGQLLLVCPSLELVVVRLGYSFDGPVGGDEQDDNFSRARLMRGILHRLGLKSKYYNKVDARENKNNFS